MIVVLQLIVLRRIEGRRRTRVIALMGAVWAVSWVLLGATGLVSGTWAATLLVAACASVFAFGETLLQPTIPALVNDLAPDHLRGRYNAASSAAFQLAQIIRAAGRGLPDRPRPRTGSTSGTLVRRLWRGRSGSPCGSRRACLRA